MALRKKHTLTSFEFFFLKILAKIGQKGLKMAKKVSHFLSHQHFDDL